MNVGKKGDYYQGEDENDQSQKNFQKTTKLISHSSYNKLEFYGLSRVNEYFNKNWVTSL
jgi:hypothetical protein